MKARVKATGYIVDVELYYITSRIKTYTDGSQYYKGDELDFNVEYADPNYWTSLEHQYAGIAMQGIIKRAYNAYCDDCENYENMSFEDAQALLKDYAEALADVCVEFAHALVEKLKEKEERK